MEQNHEMGPNNSNNLSPEVLFLAGVSYCGSTLLSIILNTHPEIVSIGELGPARVKPGASYECSCGADITKCPFFLRIKELMEKDGLPFEATHMDLRHQYSPSPFWNRIASATPGSPLFLTVRDQLRRLVPRWRRREQHSRRRNFVFLKAAIQASEKRVFLDATKHPSRIQLLAGMDIDLRVIHLLRDPRGYCYSAKKNQNKSAYLASKEWVRVNRTADHYARLLPRERFRRIQYERFCADPQRVLNDLTDFLGVSPFTLPDNFRDSPHHIIGNRMRLSSDGRTTIRLDDKWQETLTAEDRATAARVAGPLARRYGYEI